MEKQLKILAVGDPAVYAYINPKYNIIELFSKKMNTTIDFQIVAWDEYYEKMIKVLMNSDDYDVVMVAGHLWLKDLVKKGLLAEVEYPETNLYDKEDLLPVIFNEMKIEQRPYLYPSFCDGHILLYRKSVVKEILGHSLEDGLSTDTIRSLAEKCDGFKGMKGIALKAHQSEIFTDFLPFLRNEGIDAFDNEGLPTFNRPQGITALNNYLTLKNWAPKETFNFGNDEVREAFQQGKVVMAVTWGGQLGTVLDDRCKDLEDVGFAALKTSWNVTWSFGISSKSKNKELANKFLSYLTSKEVDRVVGSCAGSPVRRSTYLKDFGKHNWFDIHLKLIEKYAKPLPMMENTADKMAPLYNHLFKAFVEMENPEEALERAEKEILQIIKI
jgi:multiple sugar transport system substrate-binding protein